MNNNNWMVFSSSDKKYNVSLSDTAFQTMKSIAAVSARSETGGILIGYYNKEGSHAYISNVIPPPKGSKSSWSSFFRGNSGLKQLLDKEWEKGNYYLGEWHFHPAGSPRPSSQDIRQINQIAKASEYKCPEPILIIISPNGVNDYSLSMHVSDNGAIIHLQANIGKSLVS